MFYYYIDGSVYESDIELNESNGYANDRAKPISEQQYEFGTANKGASYDEVIAMQMTQPDPLDVAKAAKMSELQQYVASFYANGYYDATTNYLLFTTENDVMNYATLKNAIFDLADNTPVEIGTMYGWMTSTKATIYPLLVRYSQYMLPFTTKVMKATTMIEYAQTVSEVEAITW